MEKPSGTEPQEVGDLRGVVQFPQPPVSATQELHETAGGEELQRAQMTISVPLCLMRDREMGQQMNVGCTEDHATVGSITACSRAGRYGPPGKETVTMQEFHP